MLIFGVIFVDADDSTIDPNLEVYIEDSDITFCGLINQDLLNDPGIEYLTIHSKNGKGNLENITEIPLKNLSNLIELEIINHKLYWIAEDSFEANNNLRKIDFSHNELETLEPKIFWALVDLEDLNLEHNQIQELSEILFEKNRKLKVLNFAGNKIQELKEKLFSTLEDLHKIDFSFNKIKKLTENLFENNISLELLYFGNNEISQIDRQTFINQGDFKVHLEENSCFNGTFPESYDENEICSKNCPEICFDLMLFPPVNQISSGVFQGRKICQKNKKMGRNGNCRFFKKRN